MASANDLRAMRGNGWAYAHGANVAPPTRVHDELEEVSSRCKMRVCERARRPAHCQLVSWIRQHPAWHAVIAPQLQN